jgi:hypothetical protein
MATRVAGDKEGDGEGGKSNGSSNKEGNGDSGKSNGNGGKEGVDDGSKSDGNGNEDKGKGEGGKGNGKGNKGVGQGTAMATKRAMATVLRVAGNEESAGDKDCNCDSNEGSGRQRGQWQGWQRQWQQLQKEQWRPRATTQENGYGKEGGGRLTVATVAMGMRTAQRTRPPVL